MSLSENGRFAAIRSRSIRDFGCFRRTPRPPRRCAPRGAARFRPLNCPLRTEHGRSSLRPCPIRPTLDPPGVPDPALARPGTAPLGATAPAPGPLPSPPGAAPAAAAAAPPRTADGPLTLQTSLLGPLAVRQRRRPRRRARRPLPPRRGLCHPRPRRRHPPHLPRRLAPIRRLVRRPRPRPARRRSRYHRHVRGPLRRSGLRRQLDPRRSWPRSRPPICWPGCRSTCATPASPWWSRASPVPKASARAARPRPRCPACCA